MQLLNSLKSSFLSFSSFKKLFNFLFIFYSYFNAFNLSDFVTSEELIFYKQFLCQINSYFCVLNAFSLIFLQELSKCSANDLKVLHLLLSILFVFRVSIASSSLSPYISLILSRRWIFQFDIICCSFCLYYIRNNGYVIIIKYSLMQIEYLFYYQLIIYSQILFSAMLKPLFKDKQNAAKYQLLQIGQQSNTVENKWTHSPEQHKKSKISTSHSKNKKFRTQVNSPNRIRGQSDTKQYLKQHLLQLKRQSISIPSNKQAERQQTISFPLRSKNLNIQSFKTVEDIYLSKQRSEQKMRPLVYVEDFKKQYQVQQEKLRIIIKRKIMARDLIKKQQLQKEQSVFLRHFSQKQTGKKNLIFNGQRNLLPHIF